VLSPQTRADVVGGAVILTMGMLVDGPLGSSILLGAGAAVLVRGWLRGPYIRRTIDVGIGGALLGLVTPRLICALRSGVPEGLAVGEAVLGVVFLAVGAGLLWRGFKVPPVSSPAQERETSAYRALREANKLEARLRFDQARIAYAGIVDAYPGTVAASDAAQALRALDAPASAAEAPRQALDEGMRAPGPLPDPQAHPDDGVHAATELQRIDVGRESAQQLETGGVALRRKWLGHIMRELLISALMMIVLLAGLAYFVSLQAEWSRAGRGSLLAALIKAPRTYLQLMAIGWLAVGMLAFVCGFLASVIRLLKGLPKAGKTPSDTIRRYFANLAPTNLNRHSWVDAYVCLLEQCKVDFGGYESFVSSWKQAGKDLAVRVAEAFKPRVLSGTHWRLSDCRYVDRPDGLRQYQVEFTVDGRVGIFSPGLSSSKNAGSILVSAGVPLAQVGDRWYVAARSWKPSIRSGPSPARHP